MRETMACIAASEIDYIIPLSQFTSVYHFSEK